MVIIKNAKEIEGIRLSSVLVAKTLQEVKKFVRPGITTLELDIIAEDFIRSNGGKPAFKGYRHGADTPFPGTLCTSVDEEVVHGIPSQRKLKEGELLSVDVGVVLNGFYGDAAISVPVGVCSPEKMRLLEVTEKSLYEGIAEAIAGNRIGAISEAVQTCVEQAGFSVVRALCGHGVGKRLHEEPSIPNYGNRKNGTKIRDGMTLAIEPMVNMGQYQVTVANDGWTIQAKDGKPSAHFEHTIAIINGKPEILSVA